jgi:hypothetical protein
LSEVWVQVSEKNKTWKKSFYMFFPYKIIYWKFQKLSHTFCEINTNLHLKTLNEWWILLRHF